MHLTPTAIYGVGACGLWPGNPPTPARRVGRSKTISWEQYIVSIVYIGALGGEARWGPKVSMGGCENRGPTGSGATSAWLGGFRVGTMVRERRVESADPVGRVGSWRKGGKS